MTRSIAEFLESRLSRERLFIESVETEPTVEAARFGLETLDALGEDLAGVRAATAVFLAECRVPAAGYADRRSRSEPALNATYYAARLLARKLVPGALPDPASLTEWVRGEILHRGRVRADMDIDELYYAIRAVQFALAPQKMIDEDRRANVDFILRCAAAGGGFGLRPGDPGDIERTYCCVNLLETLEHEGTSVHMDWIASCMSEGQVCWNPDRATATPATFYWGLRAASLSGAHVPWEEAGRQIEAFRCEDGGYGIDGASQLWHTYCCVNALVLVKTNADRAEVRDVA